MTTPEEVTKEKSTKVRWAETSDLIPRLATLRRSWVDAYSDIFSPEEIEGLFSGKLKQETSWQENHVKTLGHLIAEFNSTIVGSAGLALLPRNRCEITSFYVDPKYQRRGIGTAMWGACKQTARELGCSMIIVWVLAKARAVQYYADRGCILVDRGTYALGNHEERALCYRLDL